MTLPPLEAAYAKINLYLHVTGRRDDGYHTLDSLVVFAGAADHLTAEPADRFSLDITGPFAAPLRAGSLDDNLVLRAATALAKAHGIKEGAALRLEKNLPLASGIGGGSADAAATLRLLGRIWGLDAELPAQIAIGLGADVPVCLSGAAAIMRGVGELLEPAPCLPPLELVLANPLVPVATASVFRARRHGLSRPASLPRAWTTAAELANELRRLGNDLQEPAIGIAPVIDDVLSTLEQQDGCLLARMSGSGATCFGLFDPGVAARRAALAMAGRNWWLWHGSLAPPAS